MEREACEELQREDGLRSPSGVEFTLLDVPGGRVDVLRALQLDNRWEKVAINNTIKQDLLQKGTRVSWWCFFLLRTSNKEEVDNIHTSNAGHFQVRCLFTRFLATLRKLF